MDSWIYSYAWCGVQAAIVVCAVYALQVVFGRRDTGSRVFVHTAGIIVVFSLSVLPFVPHGNNWLLLPGRLLENMRSKDVPPAIAVQSIQVTALSKHVEPHEERSNSGIQLLRFMSFVAADMHAPRLLGPRVTAGLRWILATMIACTLLRLLLAACWWRALVFTSRKISDPRITRLMDRLCGKLGIRRRVVLAEHKTICTAGTFGVWHPVVLLSSDWRTWDDADITAILAHELAHVRSGDYAFRLVAEICVGVHLLNPFVRLLSNSLQLAQEANADRIASDIIGNRKQYLATLAQNALREDADSTFKPVHCFLSFRSSHLMRRIDMLRSKEGFYSRRSVRLRRATITVSLLGTALLIAPLGAVAQKAKPRETDRIARRVGTAPPLKVEPVASPKSPFNISYIHPNNNGVFGVRLASILRHPELAGVTAWIMGELRQGSPDVAALVPAALVVDFDQLEQVTGPMAVSFGPRLPKGQRGVGRRLSTYFRTTMPYDWAALVQSVSPETKVVDEGNQKRLTNAFLPFLSPSRTFLVLDEKSIVGPSVFYSEEEQWHAPEVSIDTQWPEAWDYVKRGDMAWVYDNHDNVWGRSFDMLWGREDLKIAKLWKDANLWKHASAAIEINEKVEFRVMLVAHDLAAANKIVKAAPEILEELSQKVESQKTPLTQAVAAAFRDATIRQQETTITLEMESKISASELLRLLDIPALVEAIDQWGKQP